MGTRWAKREDSYTLTRPASPPKYATFAAMKLPAPLALSAAFACIAAANLFAQAPADPLVDGLRLVEVASVADAAEQLYGQRIYMSHDMRPLFTAKFAGPAVTVLLKKEEHHEGAAAAQGMLDAIDAAPPAPSTSWFSKTASTLPVSAASCPPP